MSCKRLCLAALLVCGSAACSVGSITGASSGEVDGGSEIDDSVDAGGPDLSFDYDTSGPWLLPPWLDELAQGYDDIGYDDPPPWEDGANCGGSFLPGTQKFSVLLQESFAQISSIDGYSCRPNTANTTQTSVHGTGRAIDIFIPLVDEDADNLGGDLVANWLVYNAESLGVQLVIWDRSRWIGVGSSKHDSYGGPVPHIDHLHVELTEAAAQ